MKTVSYLLYLLTILAWFPVHICLRLQVEEAQNLHFRHVGNVAGTVAMAHVMLPVNTSQHNSLISQLCTLPAELIKGSKSNFTYSQRNVLTDLKTHCENLHEAMLERERIWFNSFNDRSRKSRRVEVEVEECPNETPFDISCKPKSRKKRQFIIGAIAVAGLVAGVSALFSELQLQQLSSKVKADQEVNIAVLQEHETRVAINTRSVELLNSTVLSMASQVSNLKSRVAADEMLNHIAYTMDTTFVDTTRVIRGLNSLANHRLSPDLIQVEPMARELKILADNMQREGFVLGLSRFDDIFRCETSHVIFDNDTMVIMIHIPAYKSDTHLRLLEHVPVPMVVEKTRTGAPNSERSSTRPATLLPAPQHNLIAVTPDDSAFKVFSRSQLRDCLELGGTYYCSNTNLYDRRLESSCIIGLYRRNQEIITDHCLWEPRSAKDFAVQLEANKFLIYQQTRSDVKLVCGQNTEFGELEGLQQVYVAPGCRFFSASFIFDGQANFSLSVASFIEKNINITSLLDFSGLEPHDLEDVLAELHLVGSSEGLTIRSIKKRYSKLNMDSSWDWGTRSIVAVIACLVGLFVIWRIIMCCRKEEKRRGTGESFSFQFNQVLGRGGADPNLEAAASRLSRQPQSQSQPLEDALLEANPDAIALANPDRRKPLPREPPPPPLSAAAQKIAALDPDQQADLLHDEFVRGQATQDAKLRLIDQQNQED